MSPGNSFTALHRLVLWGALLFAGGVQAGEVRTVSLSQGATGTRAEIELAGNGQYKTLSLKGPDRLVVDLPASHARAGLRLPAAAGIVKSVRTGQPTPDTLRIVFDLATPVAALSPRMEQAEGVSRLVIEWPGDAPAAAAASTPVRTAAAQVATTTTTTQPAPDPQADAARATALLTAQVVQGATAPSPAPPPSQAAATPTPQAILEGASTAAIAPAPASTATPERPAYTIATGKPTPMPGRTAETAPPATAAPAGTAATDEASPPSGAIAMRAGMRPLVVAIDAGHGGQDSGAVGQGGTYEKNVVLAIARELARQVNATPGMKAYLTRDSDVFIPLPYRAQRARTAKADIFVSIHADAAENRSARGSSVYVLSLKGASSQRARWLADKENASDLIGGVTIGKDTLSNVLLDLAQSGHMRASEDAAQHVLSGLKRIGNNHKPNIERANFAVLRTSDMPAMLVETAFISNPDEEKRLKDPAYQRQIAAAVLDGVQTYFTRQPPPGTLFAARAQAEMERATAGAGVAGSP